MPALVTGTAGFIGSQLSERLLAEGHRVIGVDSFTDYYARDLKTLNLEQLRKSPDFTLVEADLAQDDLTPLVEQCDVVFHLAGEPGVRSSWGEGFERYLRANIWATQRLLEAVRGRPLRKFVFASSSSVYGQVERLPAREDDPLHPVSPYGVSKLGAEQLCFAYARSYDVPVVAMRYFTVYGPRQRPDMLIHRVIASLRNGTPIPLFGDGQQTRDFTYVSDAVEATYRASVSGVVGQAMNIGGGSRISVIQLITDLGDIMQRPVLLDRRPAQPGDVRDTEADTSRARELIGYQPQVDLGVGLREQVAWDKFTAAVLQ
jgi:nucleoside-diphosphate-sugar epimerase